MKQSNTLTARILTSNNNLFKAVRKSKIFHIKATLILILFLLPAHHLIAVQTYTVNVNQFKPIKLSHSSAKKCIKPNSRIIIYGKNLNYKKKPLLVAYPYKSQQTGTTTHTTISLRITRIENDKLFAFIAASRNLQANVSYYIGLREQKTNRWLSNIIFGFILCNSKPSNTTQTNTTNNNKHSNTQSLLGNPNNYQALVGLKPEKEYRDKEVMLMSSSLKKAKALLKTLRKNGYRIKKRIIYKDLGIIISVFKLPKNIRVSTAITQLRKKHPKTIVDANHIYQLHAKSIDKTLELIKWGKVNNNCGKHLRIGMLDTEVQLSHPALKKQYVYSQSFLPAGTAVAAKHHATAIASLLVGNPQSGFTSVVPGAKLYVAGVFTKAAAGKVETDTSILLTGLRWLVKLRVDAINLSLGGPRNLILEAVLNKLLSKQIIVVASAGNSGKNAPPVYPAAQPGVVAVTAVDQRLKLYRHANQGNYIDFAAPGVYLKAANANGSQNYVSGTSYAAPFVTAALTILRQRGISFNQLFNHLKNTSKDLGKPGKDKQFGWGVIQLPNACAYLKK